MAAAFDGLMAHLRRVSAVRWGHAVADDFFSKQLPNNVTWLLTLMYSLDQSGARSPSAMHLRCNLCGLLHKQYAIDRSECLGYCHVQYEQSE